MLAGPLGYNLSYVIMVTCSMDILSVRAIIFTVKLKAHLKTQNLLLEPCILNNQSKFMITKTILKTPND